MAVFIKHCAILQTLVVPVLTGVRLLRQYKNCYKSGLCYRICCVVVSNSVRILRGRSYVQHRT